VAMFQKYLKIISQNEKREKGQCYLQYHNLGCSK
jgi:hypothetical protein